MNDRIDTLRSQWHALAARAQAGTLDAAAHAEARRAIERQIVDAVLQGPAHTAAATPVTPVTPAASSAPAASRMAGSAPAASPMAPSASAASPMVASPMAALPTTAASPTAPSPTPADGAGASSGASGRLVACLGIGVLTVAVAGYNVTGSPGRPGVQAVPGVAVPGVLVDGGPLASQATQAAQGSADATQAAVARGGAPQAEPAPVADAEVAEIVDRMAQRLQDDPDNGSGWALLARAYSALGRVSEAVPAYRNALRLLGDDATLLAEYADALVAQNNGQFSPEASRVVAQALAIEPGNVKALAMSGSAAFDQRDYAAAVQIWARVERSLPPDSRMLPQVRASIAQARQLGDLPPPPVVR
jgi:cytochrome c-type biogenesis protein CcmH